jgi:hypothetical protein
MGFDQMVSLRPQIVNFAKDYHEYIHEFEAICEMDLAHKSGPSGDCLIKKTEGQKSLALSL